jgi:porphobilinogen synthase
VSGVSAFPATRLRRLRRTGPLRGLVRETRLDLDDFVMPLFVGPSTLRNDELPGMSRWSVEELVGKAGDLTAAGVSALLLFGVPEEKDEEGSGAWEDDGVVQRALRALRSEHPELVLVTDVCLCEYTSHGHCGIVRDGEIVNDETLDLLARTAASHVQAGADAVAPSDMMDGRVAAIREVLPETPIVSYAAKYASAFYGPFRDVAESTPAFGDRRSYQMDPANVREALRECELDLAEGADVLMVKPALPYLDVIRAVRERFDWPVAAYNVSGEYALVKAAAAAGHVDERAAALESLTSIKRAGIRLYGRSVWRALPLGLPIAVSDSLSHERSVAESVVILVAAAPLFTLAYAWASALAADIRPARGTWGRALVLGTLAFLPAAVFFPWFLLLSVAWLSLVGLVVPVVMIENLGGRAAFRRAVELCRADYVHALGSLATLVIVFVLTRLSLGFLLREQADNTIRAAAFVADLVVSPLLFLGAALLYFDQAARVGSRSRAERRR